MTETKTTSTKTTLRHPFIEGFVSLNITDKKHKVIKITNELFEYAEKLYSIECGKSKILGTKTECECRESEENEGCNRITLFYEVLMGYVDLPPFLTNTDHGIECFINMVEELGLEREFYDEYLKEIGVKGKDIDSDDD